jgi:restriction system protein
MPMLQGFWEGFSILFRAWQIWLPLLGFMFLASLPSIYQRWRLSQARMDEVDRMDGIEFEQYLEILFRRLGYQVTRTRAVGDQGADLVLSGKGERIVVQAKRWSKNVGNKAVQEVVASRPLYKCDRAMVVSNREFTSSAVELAAANQVELWGRRKLADVILSMRGKTGGAVSAQGHPVEPLAAARQADAPVKPTPIVGAAAPTCDRCGKPMVRREGARGAFYGCSGYPRCRGIKAIEDKR